MKRILSILLSLTLVFSMLAISNGYVVNAVENQMDWKSSAIITPEEGALVGAGYINIKFDTTLENAKSYTVYFDGKNENDLVDGTRAVMFFETDAEDTKTCEVYSVSVKKGHTVYVVATLKDGTEVTSDTRTFYISKKGVAMGGDMSETVEIGKLNISWYYNWAATAFNSKVDEGVAHVPMVWGAAQSNLQEIKNITNDSNYILGYNEPDIGSQANISAGKALAAWRYIEATGKRTVSPALAVYTGGFMDKFLITGDTYDPTQDEEEETSEGSADEDSTTDGEELIELEGGFYAAVDVDAIALHRYGGSKTGSDIDVNILTSAIDWLWEKYHKPIWVTEVSVTGKKGAFSDWSYEQPEALERMKKYVKSIIEIMDADDRVERYAWFPYNVESLNEIDGLDGCGTTALFDYESGKFTELGVLYSEMGNPEGYSSQIIADDEKYIWKDSVEETNTTIQPTINNQVEQVTKPLSDSLQEQSTAVALKVGKTNLKKAKNLKSQKVSLKWTKVKYAKKYQIQYSINKKFKKKKKFKTKKITTNKLSYTVKKLTKNKTYYFRVRAVDGKTVGKWSNIRKVKIKK